MSTKRLQTVTTDDSSTLTNLTEIFDKSNLGTGECKILCGQVTGTQENKRKAVMLDFQATCRDEGASNFLTSMAVVIIITYILYTLLSGFYSLSRFLCYVLSLFVISYLRMCFMNIASAMTQTAVSSVCGKCDIFENVMQSSVHDRDTFVKIKYRKEFRSRHAKFVLLL